MTFIVKTCDLYRFSNSRTWHSPQNKCRFWVSSKKLGRRWCKSCLLLCVQSKTIEISNIRIFSWHNLFNIKWFDFKCSHDDLLFILDMYGTIKDWLLLFSHLSCWQLFVQSLPFFPLSQQKVTVDIATEPLTVRTSTSIFFKWRRILVHILVKLLQVIVNGPGRLVRWNLYVTYNVSNPQVPIRMQIWQKVQNQESTFKLLYETRYVLTSRDNGNVTVADN